MDTIEVYDENGRLIEVQVVSDELVLLRVTPGDDLFRENPGHDAAISRCKITAEAWKQLTAFESSET